ncbi:MAG: hypothetical protein AB7S99_01205 [Pseudodonghicola sp.]
MLIMTTNALSEGQDCPTADLVDDWAVETRWPGPKVLVILPDAGLPRRRIEALNKAFIVIEHLRQPAGGGAVLCDAAGWLRSALQQADWPLLYLDRPFDAADLQAQADLGRSLMHDIEADFSGDGRLGLLRLGEMVATSPLLLEFFDFMTERPVEDEMLVDLLRATFV